jgi:NAD(P)-dependent dehydrogenase (short-subunit alcohol dehydrogenase family)
LGTAVARRAEQAGATAVLIDANAPDLAAVIRKLGRHVTGAIHLASISDLPTCPTAGIELSYHSVIALAAALDTSAPVRIVVATTGAESVLAEPVLHPEAALVAGPVLVLPTEIRGMQVRACDLVGDVRDVDMQARELIEEAATGDAESFVARRAGRRWVRRYERVPLPPADPSALPLKPRGVYLITGGLGGIGLTLARWLAQTTSARLLLTSRNPRPDPEAIRAIEQAGGEVLVATADATDEVAMRRAIDSARARWGEIDGVIHGAGVAGTDHPALRKSVAEVQAVIAPKLDGVAVLVRILGATPLDFVALLSSTSAVVGGFGLCDYAAANAGLDAFVDSVACPAAWRRVVAVNYAAWRDVGMAAGLVVKEELRKVHEAFLNTAISPAAGADSFARVLASGRKRVVVAPFDLFHALAVLREQRRASAVIDFDGSSVPVVSQQARPTISTKFAAPTSDIERRLAAIWTELLGVERIGVNDDFFELGGHSLLATRVLARIDVNLGVRLTLRDAFEAPTIQRLAERVNATSAVLRRSALPDDDREEIDF